MGVGTVAGTKLYIGAASLTPLLANDVSFVEVKDVSTLGDISQAFTQVKVESVGSGDSYDLKGTRDFPQFAIVLNRNDTDPGQIAMRAASAAARGTLYNFKIDEGDTPAVLVSVVTITIASPGVVTQTAHGRLVNDAVVFSTTGALPTGILAGTTYYVKTVIDPNTFTLSATAGGAVINTTGTQSGIQTITTVPSNTISTWQGEIFGFGPAYGGPNVLKLVKTSISIRPTTYLYAPAAE